MKLKPTPEEVAAQAEAKAQAFADVAMATDQAVKTCLDVIFTAHPDQEDAVVSGAMTALVRFGIERQQAAADAWVKQGKLGAVVTPARWSATSSATCSGRPRSCSTNRPGPTPDLNPPCLQGD
jgi:hypothetical protein